MEIWEARRLDKIQDAGRTHPLIIECASTQTGNSQRRSFIVKALALPEIKETSLGFEIVGNMLARRLGVDTPEPVLVHLSPAFVEAYQPIIEGHTGLVGTGAKLLPGYGAGCEFLSPGFMPIIPGSYLNDNELQQAACIYAFDLLVQNPDRSFEADKRPNCANFGHRLVAFDFELAFSFVYLLFNSGKPWEVTKHGIAPQHLFYKPLRAAMQQDGKIDLRPFVANVATLDVDDLIQSLQSLPTGWAHYADKIEAHLKEIVAHPRDFELELHRSLA